MHQSLFVLILFWSFLSQAADPAPSAIDHLRNAVKGSDLVLIGQVKKVEMMDEGGKAIEDPKAQVGHASKNKLFWHVKVHEVLHNPTKMKVSMDDAVIHVLQKSPQSLGGAQGNRGEVYLLMLKSGSPMTTISGTFTYDPALKKTILDLIQVVGPSEPTANK